MGQRRRRNPDLPWERDHGMMPVTLDGEDTYLRFQRTPDGEYMVWHPEESSITGYGFRIGEAVADLRDQW